MHQTGHCQLDFALILDLPNLQKNTLDILESEDRMLFILRDIIKWSQKIGEIKHILAEADVL